MFAEFDGFSGFKVSLDCSFIGLQRCPSIFTNTCFLDFCLRVFFSVVFGFVCTVLFVQGCFVPVFERRTFVLSPAFTVVVVLGQWSSWCGQCVTHVCLSMHVHRATY